MSTPVFAAQFLDQFVGGHPPIVLSRPDVD
jgi:hypothetical protein